MEKYNLVFLGDSITAGVIAGPELNYQKMSYAKYIRNYFASQEQLCTYHNFAVSGFTTSDILKQLQTNITHNENIAFNILDEKVYKLTRRRQGHHTIEFTHPDISISEAISDADVLFMTCGANDLIRLFRRFSEESKGTFIKSLFTNEYADNALEMALHNYMIIMEYITSLNPDLEIILLANYFPSSEEILVNRLYSKFGQLEDALFDTVANQFPNNIKLVKPRFAFKDHAHAYITSRIDIHPSLKGHQALADLALSSQTKIEYIPMDILNTHLEDL